VLKWCLGYRSYGWAGLAAAQSDVAGDILRLERSQTAHPYRDIDPDSGDLGNRQCAARLVGDICDEGQFLKTTTYGAYEVVCRRRRHLRPVVRAPFWARLSCRPAATVLADRSDALLARWVFKRRRCDSLRGRMRAQPAATAPAMPIARDALVRSFWCDKLDDPSWTLGQGAAPADSAALPKLAEA